MTNRALRYLSLPAAALVATVAAAAPATAQNAPEQPTDGQLSLGSLEQAPGAGSLEQLLPGQGGAQPATGSDDAGAAPAEAEQPAAGQGQVSQYAAGDTGWGTPGAFDPEALAAMSPETAGALGAVGSAVAGSAALSLGPQGSQTGSTILGAVLPGLTYVPGGSLGGQFVTSVGLEVSGRTVVQAVLGLGSTALVGYFENLAGKQERAELTEADIAMWTDVLDGVDEVRAVASMPPLERSDPRVQVPVIEPCRRAYPKQADLEDEEAEAQCAEATEAIARGETWTSPDGEVTVTPADAEPVVLGADGEPVPATEAETDADAAADEAADDTDTAAATGGQDTDNGAGAAAAQPVAANGAAGAQAPATQAAGPQLAATGASVGDLALAALALLAAGGGMLVAARRRA